MVIFKNFSMASSRGNFLSYEETEILRNASFFEGFGFYKAKDILKMCQELDDDPYGKVPDSAKSGDDEDIIATRKRTTQKLTPPEKRNLNKHAAILLMADNRKATSIAEFIKDKFDKQMVEVEDLETNNCLFESTLKQISNVKYITNMATGSTFKPQDLRLLCMYTAVTEADSVFPLVEPYLNVSFKTFIERNLDCNFETDYSMVVILRHLLKVRKYIFTLKEKN